jgi:hypothetical protein
MMISVGSPARRGEPFAEPSSIVVTSGGTIVFTLADGPAQMQAMPRYAHGDGPAR